ncbi:MAG: hypothetical protein NTZ21_14930 [Actinobacteria bacterium]|nr:hypothetical protein [Actinomycetota bacterium]
MTATEPSSLVASGKNEYWAYPGEIHRTSDWFVIDIEYTSVSRSSSAGSSAALVSNTTRRPSPLRNIHRPTNDGSATAEPVTRSMRRIGVPPLNSAVSVRTYRPSSLASYIVRPSADEPATRVNTGAADAASDNVAVNAAAASAATEMMAAVRRIRSSSKWERT